jgi:Matrixin
MKRAQLSVEALEAREVPAQFGIPWANGTALSVSFAPDGATVDGSQSELFTLMAESGLTPAQWQAEILRAFQAWAALADLNVGVVSDNGAALGVSGKEQADTRFGDIRIFAAPLDSNVLAITTPPGDLGGTRTGDIILNSNYNFGVGAGAFRDLFTVFLQESGHAFGVGNSADTGSAMYEFYRGVRTGLNAEDVSRIQSLYGARPATNWEPATGNDSTASASALPGTGTNLTYGDLASVSDVDWYSFAGPSNGSAAVELKAAGVSLLAARLDIYNSAMELLGSTTAAGPGGTLTLNLTGLIPGATYYVLVEEAPGTAFAAGAYQLTVTPSPTSPVTITLGGQAPIDDAGTNNSALRATTLSNVGTGNATAYRVFAQIRAGGDSDFYRVRSPIPGMNQNNVLTATVRAFAPDLAPSISVYNALGLAVSARVEADGNGFYTVQVDNAVANADYLIAVRSRTGACGAYELRADFRSRVTSPHQVESGLLTLLNPQKTGTVEVIGSAQIYFRLSALQTLILGPSVTFTVYDANNQVRFRMLARAGDTVDGVALLGPGTYRIAVTGNGSFLPFVASSFTLAIALMTDPIGATPSDPNQSGGESSPPPPPSGYNYYNDRGYYTYGEKTPTTGNGV